MSTANTYSLYDDRKPWHIRDHVFEHCIQKELDQISAKMAMSMAAGEIATTTDSVADFLQHKAMEEKLQVQDGEEPTMTKEQCESLAWVAGWLKFNNKHMEALQKRATLTECERVAAKMFEAADLHEKDGDPDFAEVLRVVANYICGVQAA